LGASVPRFVHSRAVVGGAATAGRSASDMHPHNHGSTQPYAYAQQQQQQQQAARRHNAGSSRSGSLVGSASLPVASTPGSNLSPVSSLPGESENTTCSQSF
jgi:hypothetical protein